MSAATSSLPSLGSALGTFPLNLGSSCLWARSRFLRLESGTGCRQLLTVGKLEVPEKSEVGVPVGTVTRSRFWPGHRKTARVKSLVRCAVE